VILFRFSPVNFARKAFEIPEKLKEIKDDFVGDGFSRPERIKNKKETEKLDKRKQELEKEFEKLKKEKEEIAKAKQPKQLKIDEAPKSTKKIQIIKKEA
jgi:cell division protein FtsB